MNRKKGLRDLDALSLIDDTPDGSTVAIDSALFGAIQNSDANRQSASPVSIFDIMPDPRQPRRAIPYVVRQSWDGNPHDLADLFNRWVGMIEAERGGTPFDVNRYLAAVDDIERPEEIGPMEESFLTLMELAVSIRQEGLTNPITVAPIGLKYQLETGERRWLSYHLLYLHTQDQKFAKVAARTVEKVNIWRQAAENNARSNLNAISKARQFAVLLMDLLEAKRGDAFSHIDQFEREQLYYAQIADGDLYSVPRNTGERLLAAMGLKNTKQLRDYRALLKLPGIVWQIADDMSWSEYHLRGLREQAGDNLARLSSMAIEQARSLGYSVPVGAVSEEMPVRGSARQRSGVVKTKAPGTREYYQQMTRLIGKSGPKRPKASLEALGMVREFRIWLDEQERLLTQYAGSKEETS